MQSKHPTQLFITKKMDWLIEFKEKTKITIVNYSLTMTKIAINLKLTDQYRHENNYKKGLLLLRQGAPEFLFLVG